MTVNFLNQSPCLFQHSSTSTEVKDVNQTAAAIKIQRCFRNYLVQNEETKKIYCPSSHFQDTEELWKNLTKIVKEDKTIQKIHLIHADSSLIIPVHLIQILLKSSNRSMSDLFKRQEIELENGKLLLNGLERALLMQESPYFKSLWNGNFKESQLDEQINLAIPKDHLEILLDLLKLPPSNDYNPIIEESTDESPSLLNPLTLSDMDREGLDLLFKLHFFGNDQAVNWSLEELTSLLKTTNFLGMHKISQALEKEIIKKVQCFNIQEKDFELSLDLWDLAEATNCLQLKQTLEQHFVNCLKNDLITDTDETVFIKHVHSLSKTKITFIDLSFCDQLTGKKFAALRELKDLKSINLSYCINLTDQDIEGLKDFKQLRHLNLCKCFKLTDRGIEVLKELKHLESLNLSHCKKLTDRSINFLEHLKRLQSLSLNGCSHLTDEGLEGLVELKRLQSLSLKGCRHLTDKTVEVLMNLKRLCLLNLADCYRLTNQSLIFIKNLKRLYSLNLSNCIEITDEGFEILKSLNCLRFLIVKCSNQIETIDRGPEILRKFKRYKSRTFLYSGNAAN